MKINKKHTKRNYEKGYNKKNKYIVIHWVGAVSTAKNNADYFYSTYRGASANYFVDANEIWEVVSPTDTAWHCGGGRQGSGGGDFHGLCKNSNSIGIEMCCTKVGGKLVVSDKVQEKTGELVRFLQKKYDIPDSRVIRHYDVTGKACPGGFLTNDSWRKLKGILVNGDRDNSVESVDKEPIKTLYYPKYTGKSNSLVDGLKAVGVTATFTNRKKIAKANGIVGYVGTANQNTRLLNLLKSGKLKK